MGNQGYGDYSGMRKFSLGWLSDKLGPNLPTNPTSPYILQLSTNPGTYTYDLFVYSATGNNLKTLTLFTAEDNMYHIEYRQPVNNDTNCHTNGMFNGVQIRWYYQNYYMDLLYMNPITSVNFSNAPLQVGQTLVDPKSNRGQGISITLNSMNSVSANVTVKLGITPQQSQIVRCRGLPQLTVTPNTGSNAGTIGLYNADGSCTSTTAQFNFTTVSSTGGELLFEFKSTGISSID